jgi:putative aldouronate transport system permease protein
VFNKSLKSWIILSLSIILRVGVIISAVMMFFPGMNPARITGYINKNMSLFTSAISHTSLVQEASRAIRNGWVDASTFWLINWASIIICLGIGVVIVGAALTLGNLRFKNLANRLTLIGSLTQMSGLLGFYGIYRRLLMTDHINRVMPQYPSGSYWFIATACIVALASLALLILMPKASKQMAFDMRNSYQLFLMFLPFIMLIFVFSYLPLWGWRYAFFNYSPGEVLTFDRFVGFHWFKVLVQNSATRQDILRVLRNTLAMSSLGLLTSWVPMVFAIFLAEITSTRYKRFVQVFTTIPNFISWVLVYALALAMFSTDGFVNGFMLQMGWTNSATNFLMGDSYIWLKMLAWGMWKGLGWSAIIYIAAISSIDPQLYEAATVDGAGRFQKMLYITLPSLMPTYFVLLVMAIAAILSNGMDQYLVFENPTNTSVIEVLDLYVYHLGIDNNIIPLSTVIGMLKSVISIALLFAGNKLSKIVRGESIV